MQIPLLWIYLSAAVATGAAAAGLIAFFIFRSSGRRYREQIERLKRDAQERIEELETSLAATRDGAKELEESLNSRVDAKRVQGAGDADHGGE